MRWLLPVALLLTLTGYFAPWVNHRAAGLVVTGLDLGEYVKFLPSFRDGTISVWRPGFYAPLVAVSAAALFASYRPRFHYHWTIRSLLLLLTAIAALNLVPPAWTPSRLLEPEFRLQTASLLILLAGTALAPFMALLSDRLAAFLVTLLVTAGIMLPLYGFFQILGEIQNLYGQPLAASWGVWLMTLGLLLVAISYWQLLRTSIHETSKRKN